MMPLTVEILIGLSLGAPFVWLTYRLVGGSEGIRRWLDNLAERLRAWPLTVAEARLTRSLDNVVEQLDGLLKLLGDQKRKRQDDTDTTEH